MPRRLKLFLPMSLVAAVSTLFGAEHKALKAFPPAAEGMERFVIVLPHKERGEEDTFQVELIAGKEMMTDGVNQVRLAAEIQPVGLKGWGYTYYEVSGSFATMSTLMAPPPGTTQVKKFVSGASLIVRYNSRLPIVVYAPTGCEIRYRIWSTSDATELADRG